MSRKLTPFGKAFDNARTRGQKIFTFKGKKYTTDKEGESKLPRFLDEKAQRKNKRKALGITSTSSDEKKAVRERLSNQDKLRKEITGLREKNEINLLTKPFSEGVSKEAQDERIGKLIKANKRIQDRPSEDITFRNVQRPTPSITKLIQEARGRKKGGLIKSRKKSSPKKSIDGIARKGKTKGKHR